MPYNQEHKQSEGKAPISLVPMDIVLAIAKVREYGNRKYAPDTWVLVPEELYLDACYRHLIAYTKNPDEPDAESGMSHLWHAATNLAFLIAFEERKTAKLANSQEKRIGNISRSTQSNKPNTTLENTPCLSSDSASTSSEILLSR